MSATSDFVLAQPLFCHHDHHISYADLDAQRESFGYDSLLSYATADLATAEGPRAPQGPMTRERIERLWPKMRLTGYGRAVSLGCRELFGLEFAPENFEAISEALQTALAGRTAAEVCAHFVAEKARNLWTIHDYIDDRYGYLPSASALNPHLYPNSYRFTLRLDHLLDIADDAPIAEIGAFTGRSAHSLDQLLQRLNEVVTTFLATGKLAVIKIAVAYLRDLSVSEPTRHEAENAFNRIRNRTLAWGGLRQDKAAVDATTSRALSDFLLHALMGRASDEDLPVQVHTGYLEGNWRPLDGTQALRLLPLFGRYRDVRFDVFHGSWPLTAEMGAIAKTYPNVWIDMCWLWAMNPGQAAQALSQWLDCLPFNKIFAYGADTWLPWGNVGYSLLAKQGVARVLEEKISSGVMSQADAREVAEAIMLRNGLEFYGPE